MKYLIAILALVSLNAYAVDKAGPTSVPELEGGGTYSANATSGDEVEGRRNCPNCQLSAAPLSGAGIFQGGRAVDVPSSDSATDI